MIIPPVLRCNKNMALSSFAVAIEKLVGIPLKRLDIHNSSVFEELVKFGWVCYFIVVTER